VIARGFRIRERSRNPALRRPPPDRVAITVHLKDGSAGSYEVERQSRQEVLELLQPVATQLGIRISVEATAAAGVLPTSQLSLLAGGCATYRFGFAPGASRVLASPLIPDRSALADSVRRTEA